MNAGVGIISGMALAVAGWLWWHRNAPKLTTFLALVAGLGIGGALGALLGQLISRLLGTIGTVSGQWLGIGGTALVAGLALVATLEVVIKGMAGKRAKPKRWHPILALVLPTIVIAGGIPLIGELMTAMSTGMAGLGAALTGG